MRPMRILGVIVLFVGIGLLASGGAWSYVQAQVAVGEIEILSAPSSVNQGETFTVTFRARLTYVDDYTKGTYRVNPYPYGSPSIAWSGGTSIYVNSESWKSGSMTVKAPTDRTGSMSISVGGIKNYYTLAGVNSKSITVGADPTPKPTVMVLANPSSYGSVSGGGQYSPGAPVTVRATANSGYEFYNWSGHLSGSENPKTFTMPTTRVAITANFRVPQVLQTYPIYKQVNPTGAGSVSFSPSGGVYEEGTEVTITASPAGQSSYEFDRWTGDASGTSATITITVDYDKLVIANFVEEAPPEPISVYLTTVVINGEGTIEVTPDKLDYAHNETVTLRAVPNVAGPYGTWQFEEWGEDLSGSENPKTITMNSDMSVTASFVLVTPEQVTLTVIAFPDGSGSVVITEGKVVVDVDETLNLQASPNEGWEFDYWSGDVEGQDPHLPVYMNVDKTAIANFKEKPSAADHLPLITMIGGISMIAVGGVLIKKGD